MHRVLIAALAALVIGFTVPTHPVAAATDEIRTNATTTYTVVPAKGQVRVTIVQRITNLIPSTATTIFYVDSTWIWVEAGAKGLNVTSDGGPVTLHTDKKTQYYHSYSIGFPRIFKGHSRTVTATYILPAGAPRSATTDRINPAYLNFWAFTQPTDTASLKVLVPKAFTVETTGGDVTETTAGATKVYASGPVADPTKFWLGITGTNLAGFTRDTILTSDGRAINVLGWPGDAAWMASVRGEAAASIPKLVTFIGHPLPGSGPIDIRETAGSDLGDAYIALFDPKTQIARVSEDYSQNGTVTHELSHAWFNDSLFDSRWMSEGYAQWIERALGTNSHACDPPGRFPGIGSPNLGKWVFAGPRATEAELDAVDYEYDASCYLIAHTASMVGPERMQAILHVLMTPDGAYAGVQDRTPGAVVAWRDWLDAVDEEGMRPAGRNDVSEAGDLLVTYGIAMKNDLVARSEARAALDKLRDQSKDWDVPPAILTPMARWTFDDAQAAITEAESIISTAGDVEQTLPSVDAETGPVHTSYEAATDTAALVDLHAKVADQLDAAKVVAGAVAASKVKRGFVEELGLDGVDLATIAASGVAAVTVMDTATARSDAAQVTTAIAQASDKGTTKIATVVGIVVAVLLVLIVLLLLFRRRRRKTRRAGEAATAARESAAMESAAPHSMAASTHDTPVSVDPDPTIVSDVAPEPLPPPDAIAPPHPDPLAPPGEAPEPPLQPPDRPLEP